MRNKNQPYLGYYNQRNEGSVSLKSLLLLLLAVLIALCCGTTVAVLVYCMDGCS